MGSKQSTSSGGTSSTTASDETSHSSYSRDYRAADAAETAADSERARANRLAALFAGNAGISTGTNSSDRNSHATAAAAVLQHNRQSALESIFSPFGMRPSASSNNGAAAATQDGQGIDFAHTLPGYLLFPQSFAKCPFCSKTTMPDDFEVHVVMCLTKPQLTYNEDILTEDKGECVICLEDMSSGNKIARLPCLCIYHKVCIDNWFQVNRSCPEHPSDD